MEKLYKEKHIKFYSFDYLWKWIRKWFDDELNPKFEITFYDLNILPFGIFCLTMTDANGDYVEDVDDWFTQRTNYMEKMLDIIYNDKETLKEIYGK